MLSGMEGVLLSEFTSGGTFIEYLARAFATRASLS